MSYSTQYLRILTNIPSKLHILFLILLYSHCFSHFSISLFSATNAVSSEKARSWFSSLSPLKISSSTHFHPQTSLQLSTSSHMQSLHSLSAADLRLPHYCLIVYIKQNGQRLTAISQNSCRDPRLTYSLSSAHLLLSRFIQIHYRLQTSTFQSIARLLLLFLSSFLSSHLLFLSMIIISTPPLTFTPRFKFNLTLVMASTQNTPHPYQHM